MLVRERFMVMNKGIEMQNKRNANLHEVKNILSEGKALQINLYELINRMKLEERRILKEKMEIVHSKVKFTNYVMIGGPFFSIIILMIAFSLLNKGKQKNLFDSASGKMTVEELEEIVKHRTEEISTINKKLYAEIDKHKIMEEAILESEKEYRMIFELDMMLLLSIIPKPELFLMSTNRHVHFIKFPKQILLVYHSKHFQRTSKSLKRI